METPLRQKLQRSSTVRKRKKQHNKVDRPKGLSIFEREVKFMARKRRTLPMIPLRGITIFPYMVLHFDVGREKSIASLDEAMMKDQEIFLVPQRESKIENPTKEDLLNIGTLCVIRQLLKLPGNTVRVLVEGISRGRLVTLKEEPFYKATIELLEETIEESADVEVEALVRNVK